MRFWLLLGRTFALPERQIVQTLSGLSERPRESPCAVSGPHSEAEPHSQGATPGRVIVAAVPLLEAAYGLHMHGWQSSQPL